MTQAEKEFKEFDDLFWKLRKKFPNMTLEWLSKSLKTE